MSIKRGCLGKALLAYLLSFVLVATIISTAGILFATADDRYYEVNAANWQQLTNAVNMVPPANYDGVNITLTDDIVSNVTLTIPAGRRIKLSGEYSLYTAGPTPHFTIITIDGGQLTLDGPTITRTGAVGRGVDVNNGGTFVMNSGTISGHRLGLNNTGGGVRVLNGSNFTMNGGTISGNNAHHGAGVLVSDSSFTMEGGVITGNDVPHLGGGVYLNNSTFVMEYGEISHNEAMFGGGVMLSFDSVFTMSKGLIYDNEAQTGGGVFVEHGCTFNLQGGSIAGNIADIAGGGVQVQFDAVMNMSGDSLVYDNRAVDGAGIFVWFGTGTLNMSGGSVIGNIATGMGGGIYGFGAAINISGESLIDDNAAAHGGGIGINSSTALHIQNNAVITNNRATGFGGGIMLWGASSLHMEDGEVSGNSSTASSGGGIFVSDDSEAAIEAGSITDNTATLDGGGIFYAGHPTEYRVPLVATDYPGLTIGEDVIFGDNTARWATLPYENAEVITRIQSRNTSIFEHPLNNYDINIAPVGDDGYPITVTFLPGENGTLDEGVPTSFSVIPGTVLTAANVPAATGNAGWSFSHWNINTTETNPVDFVVEENVTFVAQYTENPTESTPTESAPTESNVNSEDSGSSDLPPTSGGNVESETGSPETGDNTAMILWLSLLVLSSSMIIWLTLAKKQRKLSNK